jgi:hypothetical protein
VIQTHYEYIYIPALAMLMMTTSVTKTCLWLLQNTVIYSCTCHLEDGNISGQNMSVVAVLPPCNNSMAVSNNKNDKINLS